MVKALDKALLRENVCFSMCHENAYVNKTNSEVYGKLVLLSNDSFSFMS